jgi:DamX protein
MASQSSPALAPEAIARLGLARDPFAENDQMGFVFADAAHKTQINVALQLLQASDRLLIVRGEAGIGKTAFLQGLSHRRTAGLKFCRMAAEAGMAFEELLGRFLREAGLVREDEQLSVRLAAARLADASRMGERAVLMLDDAHKADDVLLERLLSLRADTIGEGAPFGLVLSVEPGFDGRLESFRQNVENATQLHIINLYPYSEKQTLDYLAQRLALAGESGGNLLSESQRRDVHVRAKGVPAAINAEARRLLAEHAAKAAPAKPARKPKSNPRRLQALVAGAVVALVGGLYAALLVVEQGSAVEPAVATAAVATGNDTPYGVSIPSQYGFEPATQAVADAGAAAEASLETGAAETIAAPVEAEAGGEEAADAAPAAEAPAVVEAEPLPAPESPIVADTAPAVDVAEPVAAEPAPVVTAQLTAAAPKAEPAVAPPGAETTEASPPGAAQWLLARADDRYTIQIIGAGDRQVLQRYLARNPLLAEAALVHTVREDKDWFVAVLGDYPSWSAAKSAIAALPADVRKNGPFPRKFEVLKSSRPAR